MFSFRILIISCLILSASAYNCFTMPPKVTQVFGQHNLPDINSETYVHDTHECPVSYISNKEYSHLIESFRDTWYLYSYVVCCEGGLLYTIDTILG
jgi:hypothetical protein